MDETKYKKVEQWLSSIYGDDPVPQFEIDPVTINILHQLAVTSQQAEQNTDLLIADLEQKAMEYAAETEYFASVFEVLRIKPEHLSSHAQSHLRVLTDLASTLDLKDASDTSYLSAMTSLGRNLIKTADARERVITIGGSLHEKTAAALKKAAILEKTVKILEEQCELQAKCTSNRIKEAKFMRGKAREYCKTIDAYRKQLPTQYVTHEDLVRRSEELEELNKKLVPLKSRLNGYHSLPPNIGLTKVKIEETKREIQEIGEELSRIVSEI